MIDRVRRALRTNDTQVSMVGMLTALNILAATMRDGAPLWLFAFAALFWPTVAFISNLIDPMPAENRCVDEDT